MTAPPARLRAGDRFVWTQPDGAVILVRVTRVSGDTAWLRCHHGGRSWTRRHTGPLFPSMRAAVWTTAELLETPT